MVDARRPRVAPIFNERAKCGNRFIIRLFIAQYFERTALLQVRGAILSRRCIRAISISSNRVAIYRQAGLQHL